MQNILSLGFSFSSLFSFFPPSLSGLTQPPPSPSTPFLSLSCLPALSLPLPPKQAKDSTNNVPSTIMWFKENKACNFSLNCPLWFWFFFFLPVAIKEFFSNVDTQGRNSLKSSSISCSCLDNFCPGMLGVRGIFFGRGVVCFMTTLKEGLRVHISKDRPHQAVSLIAFLKALVRFLCKSHSIFL